MVVGSVVADGSARIFALGLGHSVAYGVGVVVLARVLARRTGTAEVRYGLPVAEPDPGPTPQEHPAGDVDALALARSGLAHHVDGAGRALTMEQWFTLDGDRGWTLTATCETWSYDEVAEVFADLAEAWRPVTGLPGVDETGADENEDTP